MYIVVVYYAGEISLLDKFANEEDAYNKMISDFQSSTGYTDDDIAVMVAESSKEDFDEFNCDAAIYSDNCWASVCGMEKTLGVWKILQV